MDMDLDATAAMLEAPEGEMVSAPIDAAPAITGSFGGIPQTAFMPPDPTIAVGPNDVVVGVNTDLAGYTKNGTLRFRWTNMATLFSPVLPQGAGVFDPDVAYDHYAQRWIVVADARRASPAGSWMMLGVSQTPDPAGPYWVWALDAAQNGSASTNNWADYSQVGFDTQGIYITSNMFQFGGGFQYAKLRIINKAEAYGDGVGPNHFIRWYDLWDLRNPDNSTAFTVQPAMHFRGLGGNPPIYLVNALWPNGNALTLWTLMNPIAYWTGGAPTLTRVSVNCRSYELPPAAKQSGTSVAINTNDSRLLNAIYQNVGGSQRLDLSHDEHTWQGESEARSVVQWYEINIPTNTVQQNRYGAPGAYYFFPAIQTDLSRNVYLVFGRSSENEYAHLRQTGRRVGDPLNDLQNSALIITGGGSYTGGRWGDYFGICRDGGDGSQIWMYGEYAGTGSTWRTRVCGAKF